MPLAECGRAALTSRRTTVVFDLGGVLVDWDPRYLYRKMFDGDDVAMEHFLSEICSSAWNLQQDAGRSWAAATAELSARHPEHTPLIEAFHLRWGEMLAGAFDGTVAILRELKAAGTPVYALTNFSHEKFPIARERYEFLAWFDGILVSGEERLIKPDPRIFELLTERYGLRMDDLVFIDDNPRNAEAATALGMHGIHFVSPEQLRAELAALGLPLSPSVSAGPDRPA